RIPFDLGGTMCSSIHVAGYQKLKAHFGDRLSFWGGIDTQRVLPNGTPEEVKAEVRRRIRDLAPGGGYVLAAAMSWRRCTIFSRTCRWRISWPCSRLGESTAGIPLICKESSRARDEQKEISTRRWYAVS
ncbi:MAG: hypothetical protein QGI57_01935, partial [Dehalococcoidales bacterium]|nr:hypothetical protein [Dehalococcoidales bacterium]